MAGRSCPRLPRTPPPAFQLSEVTGRHRLPGSARPPGPRGRDARPRLPRLPRCSGRASRARPSLFLPPRPPPGFFVRRSSQAGPTSRPLPSPPPPPPDSARGNGPRAEFGEPGSEACEPHERAAVRAGVRARLLLLLRRGAPAGGPLSRARGPEDEGAGAGEGAGPRPAGGWRSTEPWGVSPSGDPGARRPAPQSRSVGPGYQIHSRRVTMRKVFPFQVLFDLISKGVLNFYSELV